MKRTSKLLLSLLLVLAMCLSILPASVFAADGQWTATFNYYRKEDGSYDSFMRSFNKYIDPVPVPPASAVPYSEGAEFVGWEWNGSRADFSVEYVGSPTFYAIWKYPGEEWVTTTFISGFGQVLKTDTIESGSFAYASQPPVNSYNILKDIGSKYGFAYMENWFKLSDLNALKGEGGEFNYTDDWELVTDEFARTHTFYFDYNKTITEDTTFIPRWVKTWNVTFIDDDPTDPAGVQVVRNGSAATAPRLLAREGYDLSWYYMDGEDRVEFVSGKTVITKDLTVYADWKKVDRVYYYNYYPNYPDGRVHGEPYSAEYSATQNAEEFEAGKFKLAKYEDLGFEAPYGLKFLGWMVIGEDPIKPLQPGIIDDGGSAERKTPALRSSGTPSTEEKAKITDEKDTSTDVKDKEPEILAPGTELELKAKVYVVPVWGMERVVLYRTNYFSVPAGRGMEEAEEPYYPEDTDKIFTIKSFGEAFGEDKETPLGYKFAGWEVLWSEREIIDELYPDPYGPDPGIIIGPEIPIVVEKSVEDVPAARARSAAKAGPSESESSEVAEVSAEPASEAIDDGVFHDEKIRQPGEDYDVHNRVILKAVWEPCLKVIYHNMDDEFAADKGKDIAREETEPEEYSLEQFKEADGKFLVKEYGKTGLKNIPGFEFDHWTMIWSDPVIMDAEEVDPEPDPGLVEKDELKEKESKEVKEYVSEAKKVVLVKATDIKAEEEKEVTEAAPAFEAEEKENDQAAESEKADEVKQPVNTKPGKEEDLHAEVHLFAQWTPVVYNATWVDEDKDTVLHGPVDFTVEEGQPKDTDYNDVYEKENPTKAEDENYTYKFSGWKEDPEVKDGNVVYVAQYDATPKEKEEVTHTATWVDEDGKTELNKETFKDGEDAPKADTFTAPKKDGKVFDHWDEEKVKDKDGKETGDVIYTAVYKDVPVEKTEAEPEPDPDVPSTGDGLRIEAWIGAFMISLLGATLVIRKRRED